MRRRSTFLLAMAALQAALAATLGGASALESFRVKPSALAPADPTGALRRVVHAFGDWTLICDENLVRRQRVCNVSQEIVDADGRMAFSWSLSATRDGAPVMILRTPPGRDGPQVVQLTLPRRPQTKVDLATCDPSVCIGFLPVTRPVGEALRQGGVAQVTLVRDGGPATLDLPLTHLTAALAAMKVR